MLNSRVEARVQEQRSDQVEGGNCPVTGTCWPGDDSTPGGPSARRANLGDAQSC